MITHVRTPATENYTCPLKRDLPVNRQRGRRPVSSADFPLVETLKVSFRAETLFRPFILLLRHSAIHVAQL